MLRRFRPDARVVAVETRREGQHGTAFRLRCGDGGSVILKAQRPGREGRLFDDLRALEIAGAAAVPTPGVIGADDSGEVLPWVCALLEDLGHTLHPEREDQMPRGEVRELSRAVGGGLRALHDVRLRRFGRIRSNSDGEFATNSQYVLTRFDTALAKFRDRGGDAAVAAHAERWMAGREDALDECHSAVLCHMDCHEMNIAVREEGGVVRFHGLIDLGSAAAGDPVFDLAKTHYMARRGSRSTLAELVAGYGGMPDGWRHRWRIYMLINAIELWSWFAGNDWAIWGKTYERDVCRVIGGPWRRPARGVR